MTMQIAAWVAAALVFMSFFMRTIIHLRVVAIVSNVAFMAYALLGLQHGVFEKLIPILVLHAALLPVNVLRLHELKSLTRKVREASSSESIGHLIPYMQAERFGAGETIFAKGDVADKLYYLAVGAVRLPDVGVVVASGNVFGEVGIFAAKNVRASSAICEQECRLYSISRDKALELYYQNPEFGFFLIRLVSDIAQRQSLQPG